MIKSLDYTYIDKWQATENLVRSMINSIVNTASLAEVVAVEKDKVSVSELVIQKESTVPPVIYHNITVLIPSSDKFNITYPIKKGDKGLLITCKLDISELKKTKRSCKTNVARTFDKNDSVFIPLFMNTKPLSTPRFDYKPIRGDDKHYQKVWSVYTVYNYQMDVMKTIPKESYPVPLVPFEMESFAIINNIQAKAGELLKDHDLGISYFTTQFSVDTTFSKPTNRLLATFTIIAPNSVKVKSTVDKVVCAEPVVHKL